MVSFFETYSLSQFVQLIKSIELVQPEKVQLEYSDYHINEIVQFQTG
jgi:hypothetical protein